MSLPKVGTSLTHWLFTPLAGVTFGGWIGLLRRHGRTISPRYWPRSLFTTFMSPLNSAVSRLEERRFSARIAEMRVERPIFVIGHHRSGTSHLWNLLSLDPRFAYPTVLQAVFPATFLTFEGLVRGLARRVVPRVRPQDAMTFSADSPLEQERAICASCFLSMQMARHFPRNWQAFKRYLTLRDGSAEECAAWTSAVDRFARKLLVRQGAEKTLMFKAPDDTGKIALILSLYPDARFVHIHRNPYEVYRSTMKMERTTLPLYAYQAPDEDKLEPFVLWRYRAMYEAFLHDRPKIPAGQFVEVSFDALDRDPVATVAGIYDALDLRDFDRVAPRLEAYLESLSDYKKNAYAQMDDEVRRRVHAAWRPFFEHWAYPA
ncbi:MAG: sulfotransferase [Rhodospirillales bacterium]